MIKSIIIRTAIVLAGILVVLLGRGFFYYSGFYSAPPGEMPSYEQVVVPPAPLVEFSDKVLVGEERTVLIDLAHDNNFDIEELSVLMLRLISRDITVKLLSVEDDLKKELLGEEKEEKEDKEKEEKEEEADQEELLPEQEEGDKEEKGWGYTGYPAD